MEKQKITFQEVNQIKVGNNITVNRYWIWFKTHQNIQNKKNYIRKKEEYLKFKYTKE